MPDRARLIWLASLASFGVAGLRVFDILLMKRHLGDPLIVGLWVSSLLVFLLLARRAASAVDPARRSALQRRVAAIDGPFIALCVLGLLLLFGQHWGHPRATSDGREYFVQTRSLMVDHDLDFENESSFGVRGTASMYPFGAPLLWTPFFAAADVWLAVLNLLGNDYPRDGFFNPYQRAVGLGTLFYGWFGLLLLMRLTASFFSRTLAAVATIGVCLGSFLAWYFVVDPSLPHAISMASVALFVYYWHRTSESRTLQQWIVLGLLVGLMSMVRWQNIGFAVLAAADAGRLLLYAFRARDRAALAQTVITQVGFIAAFVLAFSPQLYFWRSTRGGWLSAPSSAHAVSFTGPLRDVLFTPDHGLFTWSPLLALAMIGFLLFVRRAPWIGTLLLLAFLFQVYVLGTVESPGYGFGTRRMANCAVLFVPGAAALIQWLRDRPLVAPGAVAAVLVATNMLFMLDMHQGRLPPTGSVRAPQVFESIVARVGNPLSAPMNLWFALRYGTDLGHYERLGTQTFNNLRVDVGGPGDARFLSRGWSGPESGASSSFRWNDGSPSVLLAPLKTSSRYTLALEIAPFDRPGGERQTVRIIVNGTTVSTLDLRTGMRRYEVEISADYIRSGVNALRFEYAYELSPRSLGMSDDSRALAVRYARIEMLRR